ncbi:MAG TPA: GNAT family N-acyltransferase [Steroidobacteraceae bacterium]|nr:GNAT family N-acyltransferase [Steroidobacteraceae bacterium]
MSKHAARAKGQERDGLQIKTGERRIPDWLRRALLAAPGISRLIRLRDDAKNFADPFVFVDTALRELQVQLRLLPFAQENIPASGPVIITANHPYGGLDGLIAMATLGGRRRDLRILVNPELAQLDGIGSLMIPVDPFGGAAAKRANVAGLRKALRWLEDGGALLIFPAGEVSHLQLKTWSVSDPVWSATAARLVRISGAPVVPMHFGGANSALFQLAGIVHPRLRTLLLPHELGNKLGARVDVRIGHPLAPAKLAAFETDAQLAAHLRLKTYLLASTSADSKPASAEPAVERTLQPISSAIDSDRLSCEIETLPSEMLLVSSGRMRVYCAPTSRIPWTLQELGRLRELTFRAVGEGTGRSADIDVFDDYYEHLFIWNTETREIVGAYRLGRTDEISRRFGKRGLYTSSLFDYNELFLKLLGPALELGRSFVRPEYQKSFASLMLLWKGIGEYVARHPRYCRLIGPVSISNDYRPLSKDLLVNFLKKKNFEPLAPTVVRPKRPFRGRFSIRALGGHDETLTDIETLSTVVADLEPDGKGAPVLLRQYLKLGGRMLGFNVDPDFGNALDCLVLVDLRKTNPRVLRKYMSDAGWERFAQAHPRLRPAPSAAG